MQIVDKINIKQDEKNIKFILIAYSIIRLLPHWANVTFRVSYLLLDVLP